MLQLPESKTSRASICVAPPRTAASTNKRISTKRVSAVEKLIREHTLALRVLSLRTKSYRLLCEKHPDLEHRRPLVLFYTNGQGKKHYGRWIADYNSVFPPSLDHISPGNKAGRAKFLKACTEAQPEHLKKRKQAGIEVADDRMADAAAKVGLLRKQLRNFTPRTAHEAGLIARHIIKVLPSEVSGAVFWRSTPTDQNEYHTFQTRRSHALIYIEEVLRAFAKAAGR
jgi:hypothetical protein